jgi:FecR protein
MALLRCVSAGVAAGVLALSSWSATAVAQPSGAVIAVIQQSQADGQGGKRVLEVEAPVFSGDKIVTGPIGEAQIKFRDNTKLVVGPNSTMTIDAFVFNDNGDAKKFAINVTRGAFRFITGNGPKSAYSISTPTATIGVRGTELDFLVERITGNTQVLTLGGQSRTCPKLIDPLTGKRKPCILSSNPCGLSIVENQDSRYIKPSQERDIRVNRFFRYVLNQNRLLPEFRVDVKACGNVQNVQTFENHSGGGGTPPEAPVDEPKDDCYGGHEGGYFGLGSGSWHHHYDGSPGL